MEKLISVIILNYNNYNCTIDCLNSLKSQSYKNFEVFLVDNGSVKNLFLKLKENLVRFRNTLNLTLIRNERNLYFVSGNNKAIRKAHGDYICLLNSDVVVNPDFIEQMVKFFESHPDAGMISPKIRVFKNKKLLWNTGAFINFKSAIVIGNRGYLEYDPTDNKYNEVEVIDFAPGTAVMVRKEVIEKIGLMDEIFLMYHEDPDWNFRAHNKGYKSYYVPITTVYHNISRVINKKRMIFNHHFFTRNAQILVWKHAKFKEIIWFYYIFSIFNFGVICLNILTRRLNLAVIRLNSLWQGLRVGVKRRTNRSCKKEMISDYKYITKIQED